MMYNSDVAKIYPPLSSLLLHFTFINYVFSVGGEGGSPKDDLLNRLDKKDDKMGRVKNRKFWNDMVYGRPLSLHNEMKYYLKCSPSVHETKK